jgi:murein DD-endopeptidase MepM/ murein hydrolase activator NlpD
LRKTYFLLLFLIIFIITSFSDNSFLHNELNSKKSAEFKLPEKNLYSLEINLNEEETFLNALQTYNLSSNTVNKASKKLFEDDNEQKSYLLFSDKKTGKTKYLIYEFDPVNYLVIDIENNENIYKGKKETRLERKIITGRINQSLFASLTQAKTEPEIIEQLAQIFAWQVDFHRSRFGDSYKVIYEEEFAGSVSTGYKKILGLNYNHRGKSFYGINYNVNGTDRFYDEKGNSLRKTFLRAPLYYTRISSPYSMERFHPILKRVRPHYGTDYAAPEGTPIRAAGDGLIIAAGFHRGNGNYVTIQHNNIYKTQYLHMQKFEKRIKRGVRVKQGDVIGYVGSTGLSTGPHLCYRFWKHGVQVDPYLEDFPSAYPPVPSKLRSDFEKHKNEIINELHKIKIPWFNKIFAST